MGRKKKGEDEKEKTVIGFDQIGANYAGVFAVWEELEAARGDAVKDNKYKYIAVSKNKPKKNYFPEIKQINIYLL